MEEAIDRGSTPNGSAMRQQVADLQTALARTQVCEEVLADLPALVCRFLPDATITYVNDAYCRYFGKGREELVGTDFRDLIPEEDRGRVMANLAALSVDAPTQSHEHQVRAPNGEIRWQRWTNHALFNDEGAITAYQSIGEDVTDRRRGEKARSREHNTLQGLLEGLAGTGIGIHVIASDHTILLESDMLVERFGTGLGKKCHEHYRGLLTNCPQCPGGEALATGRLVSAEIVGGDGRHYRVFTAPISGPEGEAREVLEIAVDITDQKRAEEALRESEQKYRSLTNDVLDSSAAGIFILDANYRVVWINQAIELFFGLSRSEILGRDQRMLIEERVRHLFADPATYASKVLATYDDNACVEHFECHVRPTVDREERWLEFISSPIKSGLFAGGRIEHYYDITARRRAEAERLDLERRMQHRQKLESLGLMAGGVAHDFNNLLMTILGNADLALQDTAPAAPSYGRIREIERGAQRAADLAGQLLAYSGRGRFIVKPMSLSELVRALEPMLRISASRKTSFQFDLAADPLILEGDPSQVRQIAINLVVNAGEAIGDEDGIVSIRTGAVDDGENGDSHDPRIFLEVEDTGCGMDEDTIRRIFDPFFTTKFTGRGLGMAAVMGIVRDHGGTIDIQSEPGTGTRIRVLFPASRAEAIPDRVRLPAPRGNGGHGGQRLVLLVDDEEDVRLIAQDMLERFGLEVLTAADGREAVEMFRARTDDIDCVVLDLTMPHMDGEATLREMRRIREDVPIILSSGYSEQDVGERFADGALTGFIQKPYCSASLKSTLEKAMGA